MEANDYYYTFVKNITPGYVAPRILSTKEKIYHYIAFALFILYSSFLVLILGISQLFFRKRKKRYDANKASEYVGRFVEQYPFHLYPLLAKSLELYFLRDVVDILSDRNIIEVAIGEGSFSRNIFEQSDVEIYGFDINPYSLDKVKYENVKMKIIADCLELPTQNNSKCTILSNNLMHHITNKQETLNNWSQKGRRIVFNENTPAWASGETTIYLANLLGFEEYSKRKTISVSQAQCLLSEVELDQLFGRVTRNYKKYSFYNEFVHFLSMNYSFVYALLIQPCFGPPTPESFKRMFCSGGISKRIISFLTYEAAVALIKFDSIMSKAEDVFIYYDCAGNIDENKSYDGFHLACCNCGGAVVEGTCVDCRKKYPVINQMLFLLKEEKMDLASAYDMSVSSQISSEHL